MRPGYDSARHRSAAAAAFAWLVIVVALVIATGGISGCAVLRHRGPSPESLSAARELSRQGVAAMENGQWQQAEDLLQKSLETSPDDASTHRSMAEALWHRGAKQEAIAQIEEALEHDSDNAGLHVRAGEMSLTVGARDAALRHAERAIRADSKLASAWALRGRCFQQVNQTDRAMADLQHSLEFAPDNSDVLLDVAQLYRARGQSARCLTTLHHLLDTYPPGGEPQRVLALEGLCLLDLGRPQQAAEVLASAAHQGAPNADLLYHLAQAYASAGQIEQATATAQQVLALDGSHQASRELLSQLAARGSSAGVQRR